MMCVDGVCLYVARSPFYINMCMVVQCGVCVRVLGTHARCRDYIDIYMIVYYILYVFYIYIYIYIQIYYIICIYVSYIDIYIYIYILFIFIIYIYIYIYMYIYNIYIYIHNIRMIHIIAYNIIYW